MEKIFLSLERYLCHSLKIFMVRSIHTIIDFKNTVNADYQSNAEYGRGILKAIKNEIDNGWLVTMKGIVSAEIFTDFLEMAEHLLKEKYKDAAAVIIGS